MEEAVRMVRARSLRIFNGRGMGMTTYASLLGHLLLRTLDRAQRIYSAMWCRGFDGTIRTTKRLSFGRAEYLFMLVWISLFMIMRFKNLPLYLGEYVTELIR
jgi:cobalt/nickel transport system permease protein